MGECENGPIGLVSRAGIESAMGMVWERVSLETGRAALETKTGPCILPLLVAVVNLLDALPQVNANPWVFAGAKVGTTVGYELTRSVFAEAVKGAGLVDVKLHDLRRSLATRLAGAGVSAYIFAMSWGTRRLP